MHHTLIFLPVGIPGMGKTTLGRFLESAAHNVKLILPNSTQHATVNFTRVSYDVVFTQLQVDYTKSNPECDPVAAFDIIRPFADKEFMKQIKDACTSYKERDNDIEKSIMKLRGEKEDVKRTQIDIVYIDKNNTPDIWKANSQIIKDIAMEETGKSVITSVLLLPS